MTAQGNNNDDFDDELLSAYVDGELTAAERARVEERLRSDPAAAALVDELRSLSSEIQRLPREPLGLDLRASVLAEIDQARADLAAHGPTTLPEPPIDRWAGIRRGLVWSALAIAATIVIAIFQPPEEKRAGENVARAKKGSPAAAAPQSSQEEAESVELANGGVVELRRAEDDSQGESANDQLAEAKQKADELPPAFRAQMSAAAPPSAAEPTALGVEVATATPAPMAPAAPGEEAASTPLDALAMDSSELSGAGSLEFKEAVPAADAPASAALSAPTSAMEPQQFGMAGGVGGGGARSVGQPLNAAAPADESLRGALKATEAGATSTVTLQLANEQGAEWFRELLTKSDITPTTSDRVREAGRSLTPGMPTQGGIAVAEKSTAEDSAAEDSAAEDKAERADAASRQLAANGAFDNEADRTTLPDASMHRQAVHDRFYFFNETWPSMQEELLSREANPRISAGVQTDQQIVWVEASTKKIEQLLAECRAAGRIVKAVDVTAVVDGATASDAMASQQLGEPSAAGVGQAGEGAHAFGGGVKATSDLPEESSGDDARVRVLFVLQSPRLNVVPAAAPAAMPTVAPPATGEAR